MKSKELATWLNIAPVTVRLWSSQYGEFLSPSARGGGKTRVFSDRDMRVLAYVASMKQDGRGRDDITASLRRLQGDEWRELPDMPAAPPGVEPISVIPREAAEAKIDAQRGALMREISVLQDTVERLENDLKVERAERAALTQQLIEAREKLGELRGQLSGVNRSDWWLRYIAVAVLVLGAVVIAALVLSVVIRGG